MVLTQGAEYALYVNKTAYLFKSYYFNYSEVTDFEPIIINIDLEKASIGSLAVLNNIFFDVNQYELKGEVGSRTEEGNSISAGKPGPKGRNQRTYRQCRITWSTT